MGRMLPNLGGGWSESLSAEEWKELHDNCPNCGVGVCSEHTVAFLNADLPGPSKCEACWDKGWLLADNSDHGLRIERCDSCEHFPNDDEAVKHVARLAMKESING